MKLKVAAVQMESRNGDYEGNRQRAEAHILEAVDQGAKLISLPEFALAGYVYKDSIWGAAEPLEGNTHQWLSALCQRHGVYLATCILEKDGEDFFDTFMLCGPGGELWSHRKIEPAAYEAFFFKGGGLSPNVFDTPIGKIGIAICFDTSKTHTIRSLIQKRPEILLLQYSCPGLPSFFPKTDRDNWVDVYKHAAAIYARRLKVPVVACNKTGLFSTTLPWSLGLPYRSAFVDTSMVVDARGEVVAEISGMPGVICAEVELAGKDSLPIDALAQGRWFLPLTLASRFSTEYGQKCGRIRYALSQKRRRAALGR
ncbi:MAG: carbon-nitrogen hydrolase family protein [Desulfobacterales bacterium]|nr:carbon-nitrogen hydrolase family protein [Desulfobacterales bacterium]